MEWEWGFKFKIGNIALLRKKDKYGGAKWAIGLYTDSLGDGDKSWKVTRFEWGSIK